MKKILLLIITVVLVISCSNNLDVKRMPKIGAISNSKDYSYIGTASKQSNSRNFSSDGNKILVGLKNHIIEEIQFENQNGEVITDKLYVSQFEKVGDYVLFKLSPSPSPYPSDGEYRSFCYYIPTAKLFDITESFGYYDFSTYPLTMYSTNDGKLTYQGYVGNDEKFNGIIEVYVENNELKIKQLLDTSLVSGFSWFYKDKYGNMYSLDERGKMVTSEGKLKKIPLNNNYFEHEYSLGANGISYYNNGVQKGYFNEIGELIYILEGAFFPDFYFGDMGANSHVVNLFYKEGNVTYFTYSDRWAGGVYFRPQGVIKYTYSNDAESSYTEELLPFIPCPASFSTVNAITKFEQNGPIITVLAKDGIYKFDMRTGEVTTLSNIYSEYLEFQTIGPDIIRYKAVDENMDVVTSLLSPEGETISGIENIKFESISLVPIN